MMRSVQIVVCLALVSGCIDVNQAPKDTTDSHDDAPTTNDIATPDTDDTTEGDIDTGPICDGANPCTGALPDCQRWSCVRGRCEITSLSGVPCAEDDLCSIGVCQEGRCISVPRMCPSDDPCRTPTCSRSYGCDTVPVTNGFCEATPAFPWGECVGPLMAPPDRCSSTGICVDGTIGGPRAPDFPIMSGGWLAFRLAASGTDHDARSGVLTLALASNTATATLEVRTDSAATPERPPLPGGWCLDPAGGFSINFPELGAWVGQVARTGDVFAATRLNANDLMLGIRSEGATTDLDGAYRMVLVHPDRFGEMDLWTGAVRFLDGCVVGEPMLRHSAEPRDFTMKGGPCFSAVDTSRAGPLHAARFAWASGDAPERPVVLTGGFTRPGDVGVFAVSDGEGRAIAGLAIIIRNATAAPAGDSSWYMALAEKRAAGLDRFVYGGLRLVARAQAGRLVNGHIERVADASSPPLVPRAESLLDGGFEIRGRDGLVILTPRFDERRRHWSGAINERSRFGVFFEIPPGGAGDDLVPLRPMWPSLGLVVEMP